MTTPQEEAERRWPDAQNFPESVRLRLNSTRYGFIAGAEWQAERLGPLVEAARAVTRSDPKYCADAKYDEWATALDALMAAAAALDEEVVE